jgi:hypothetical protein
LLFSIQLITHRLFGNEFSPLFESTNIRRQKNLQNWRNEKKKKFVVDRERKMKLKTKRKNKRSYKVNSRNSRTLYGLSMECMESRLECRVQMKCILGSNYHFPIAMFQFFIFYPIKWFLNLFASRDNFRKDFWFQFHCDFRLLLKTLNVFPSYAP